jgi:uncharacterized protein with PIN domain
MQDEKDRLGEKLHQKERAEEDRFIAEREKETLERLRRQKAAAQEQDARQLARMRCPKCGERLTSVAYHDVTVEECPACHGMWLDAGQFDAMASRVRDSWLGRILFHPRR